MKPLRPTTLLLLVIALVSVFAGVWLARWHTAISHERAAVAALYASRWPDIYGKRVDLEAMRGRVLVVNFWAPWCPPCVEEIPTLNRLAQRWHPQNTQFIGIGIDTSANIVHFLEKNPTTYPTAISGFAGIDLAKQLDNTVHGLPFTAIIDKDGRIYWKKPGEIKETEIDQALSILRERPAP